MMGDSGLLGSGKARSAERRYRAPAPQAPAIKAGRHDDNAEYNRFLGFLRSHGRQAPYRTDISERLIVKTTDKDGRSLHNCLVDITDLKGRSLSRTRTYADGRTMFFPLESKHGLDSKTKDFLINADCGAGNKRKGQLKRNGKRTTEVRFKHQRKIPRGIPLDVAIVLDTTGSMGSQIERLTKTLKAIHFQLTRSMGELAPSVRFALVAYRDDGDEYLTQVTGFTDRIEDFQRVLDKLDADGGGDTPEDMQTGFDKAMHVLKWRPGGLRMGFVISDAVPHTDYGQAYSYLATMRESLARGIKWTMVGAGGLGTDGETIFRQIAQYTMGEYVFITEGSVGDSGGSRVEASHHVGANYKTENLDQAIVRIIRRELSYLTRNPKDFDYTMVATGPASDGGEALLRPAAREILRQLIDYSAIAIPEGTPVAVAPVAHAAMTNATLKKKGKKKDKVLARAAEYVTDQLIMSATRMPALKVVERDLKAVDNELKWQLSDLFDVEKAVPIGKMLGAELLIVAKLRRTNTGAELFAKLVRVESAEILSVARVDIKTSFDPS